MSSNTKRIPLTVLFLLVGVASIHVSAKATEPNKEEEIDPKSLRQAASLMEMRNYLSQASNTDIVFLVDVSYNTTEYLKPLAMLGNLSIACLKNMRNEKNKLALVTFGNSSKLEYGFHECFEEECLENVSGTVQERFESRKVGQGLRYAKHLLKIEKQNFEKQNGSKYSRKQCVVLVTFGVGENEKTFPIASRLLANNIDIIVIGLGENAAKNEATLNRIAKPKKKAKGKGFILVTEHVGYVFSLLENAIKFTCFWSFSEDFDFFG